MLEILLDQFLDEAEQSIFSLTEQKDSKIYQHIEPILSSTVKKMEDIWQQTRDQL